MIELFIISLLGLVAGVTMMILASRAKDERIARLEREVESLSDHSIRN